MPAISGTDHGTPQLRINFWTAYYDVHTAGVEASAPTTIVLSATDSVPEPDGLLRILPDEGGASVPGDKGYFYGPPELIVEVSNTTGKIDLGSKLEIYERNGVQEYLVWRTRHKVIDWFRLERGEYVPISPDADGILKSRVYPGLWLDPEAMIAGDLAKVLAVVQRGLASPEHAKFVEKLRKKAAKKKR